MLVTSASITSLDCSVEWSRALRFKRPILLLLCADVLSPVRLAGLPSLDFKKDFEQAFRKLTKQLMWMRSSTGELQTLRYRLDDLKNVPEYLLQTNRIQAEITSLQAQITYKERAIKRPKRVLEAYHDATCIEIDLDKERFDTERKTDRPLISAWK